MAELNLKQIIDRLNAEFTGETRKLVFWYDDKAEFAEDMETVELQNAKIYYLQPDNQFYTKYFLERVDKTTNYLIYAPFPKPDVRDNHLEDTMLYSRRFFADRASLLSVDLGIEEKYKPVIEKHIKFFASTDEDAYASAAAALNAICAARLLVPLIDEAGAAVGGGVRLKDPGGVKRLDTGTAQLTLHWDSRRPYNRVDCQKVMHYNLDLKAAEEKTE